MIRDTIIFTACGFLLGLTLGSFVIGPKIAQSKLAGAPVDAESRSAAKRRRRATAARQSDGRRCMQQLATLKETVAKDPNDFDALVQLGNMYMDAAKFPQAPISRARARRPRRRRRPHGPRHLLQAIEPAGESAGRVPARRDDGARSMAAALQRGDRAASICSATDEARVDRGEAADRCGRMIPRCRSWWRRSAGKHSPGTRGRLARQSSEEQRADARVPENHRWLFDARRITAHDSGNPRLSPPSFSSPPSAAANRRGFEKVMFPIAHPDLRSRAAARLVRSGSTRLRGAERAPTPKRRSPARMYCFGLPDAARSTAGRDLRIAAHSHARQCGRVVSLCRQYVTSDQVNFGLRVRDISRQAMDSAAKCRSFVNADFRADGVSLLNVPNLPNARITLRVYGSIQRLQVR